MTLPQLAQISDYAEEAEFRPISQYQGKPRLLAWILSYIRRCQELENAAWDVILKRMIDNAQNAQLDTIGKIVGQQRNGQADAVYRIYITARIRINRSHGHAADVIDVLQLIDAAAFAYTEAYPCTVWIEYATLPETEPIVLADLARLAAPSGVQLFVVAESTTDGFILGDGSIPAGTPDTAHGLADVAGTMGGTLAEIW